MRDINRRLKELEVRRRIGRNEDHKVKRRPLTPAERSRRDLFGLIKERQAVTEAENSNNPSAASAGRQGRALIGLLLSQVARKRPPVVVPQEVIDVCIRDPEASTSHECEDCGLSVQSKYFDMCPGCGGHTGFGFYHLKNETTLEKLQADIAASEGYPSWAAELEALRDRKLGKQPRDE